MREGVIPSDYDYTLVYLRVAVHVVSIRGFWFLLEVYIFTYVRNFKRISGAL